MTKKKFFFYCLKEGLAPLGPSLEPRRLSIARFKR